MIRNPETEDQFGDEITSYLASQSYVIASGIFEIAMKYGMTHDLVSGVELRAFMMDFISLLSHMSGALPHTIPAAGASLLRALKRAVDEGNLKTYAPDEILKIMEDDEAKWREIQEREKRKFE